jgi:hypothetical protein
MRAPDKGGKDQPSGLQQGGAKGQGESADRTQSGRGGGERPGVGAGSDQQKSGGPAPAKAKKRKLVNGKWVEEDDNSSGGDQGKDNRGSR